jgi:hypothetical protein
MKNHKLFFNFFLVFVLFTTFSCTSVYEQVYHTLNDGRYDSEFPYKSSSKQLEEITRSIKLLNSIAFYESYLFEESKKITIHDINRIDFEKTAAEKIFYNNTASGTATIFHEDQGYVALLSVAHIVCFPDTIISYFLNSDNTLSQYIQSISIKNRQSNYVPDLPGGGELEIILIDKTIDVAILGYKYYARETVNLPVFRFPWGKSEELEWGSFVYVFGFPMNYKMISKGIVSELAKEKNTFLIDAVFNRGSSGGIVLAIRDGVPNFELVGIVKSVPADFQFTVRPLFKKGDYNFNPAIPYRGDVSVEKEQIIRTGITKVIGIETVLDFIRKNFDELRGKGYYFKQFL